MLHAHVREHWQQLFLLVFVRMLLGIDDEDSRLREPLLGDDRRSIVNSQSTRRGTFVHGGGK